MGQERELQRHPGSSRASPFRNPRTTPSIMALSAPTAELDRAAPAILVVDDSAANLVAFRAILEPLGCPVAVAESGEEALRQLLRRDFALMVLDVQMPTMSGYELATLIKSHGRLAGVPIIFVTAMSHDHKQVFAGYAHGAVDYLVKPFQPEILRAKANVFVELYRAHQTIRVQAWRLHEQEVRAILGRNEERFRELTESLPLPVWGVAPDGAVYVCNRAWTEYSGLSAEETGSIVSARWMEKEDLARAFDSWAEGRRVGVAFDLECRLRRARDESFRWHLLRAVPEQGDRARQGFWIVAGTDIDSQKAADSERARVLAREQRAREEAEAANHMKDEFLATVSHELRTPLTAILGWSRLARTGALDETDLAHALATIERNAQVQARLINDLLDISRIISGKLRLQPGSLDLRAVVTDAVDAIRPAADGKRIDLRWECPQAEISMRGDASRLQQVIWNLLSNAVKFTPQGGRVEVRLENDGARARLVVDDDGRGIGSDFLPHVFDRFRQEPVHAGGESDGLGLGLSIVKHLVELHGGQVQGESQGPGRGATFTVLLPCQPASLDGSPPGEGVLPLDLRRDDRRAALPQLDGVRVVFVDDHADARQLVSVVLGRHGASVIAVETAEQAIDAVQSSAPHVLISDIGLPGEDGYTLIRRIRALPPSIGGSVPAVALTAFARPEDRRRAQDEGYQVHLAKPVEPDELVALVASFARAPESIGAGGEGK